MSDPFSGHSIGLSSPATHGDFIVPGVEPLPVVPRFVMAAGDGFLAGTLMGTNGAESNVVIYALAGQMYPIRFTRILPTSTATGIVEFW